MKSSPLNAAEKFDTSRANEYGRQSRIALAGYDACHDLAACMLAAILGDTNSARILVVGAGGTAQEIIAMARLEPSWRFTAVDPSQPMIEAATQQLEANDLLERTDVHLGQVDDLPPDASYDAATLIGVLHHLAGDDAKRQLLRSIRTHLKPGAPLIVAGNQYAYASQPLLLAAWGQRWRQQGASPDEVKVKLGKILQGADPPHSEAAVQKLLHDSGFGDATRFFSSLFWGAWVTCKTV
ncbi:class I SAM-dependent methyltransferase [Pseudomonas sp. FW306-02-F02-AA]|uniref:SAM-dependent methyltransferase n=1 Tax=Pseudomonas fluorescens TaxID=294 RepID=A0A0N9WZV5_PSEFL|nr:MULTISPECIES: class I SAM-dependent methyltransferase [Pseudomonas]ALI03809.1 SAM-dependent methyltransferase [Pseudomonas fluorescens]PMZ03018.1 class I SAM-dependent methyltransferase [Pseudomonas sp. FW306-02-F02-AB]PMZ11895.1 class I SAM-dependent methyltransferase [Pseudomonas sp. FW306-02-H06C]PMZ14429.1 class I SAM-dependent methyltransferase [Pseudomonas sp. FW306-02-F02-AA]PMZ20470.1 class I SAM-dependent methyltransferase [Pseudomonas sp. FW306-02-F08-AA]